MQTDHAVHSSNIIERLNENSEMINKGSPFYWYFHLENIGKRAQTKEMVEEAVHSFSVENRACTILKVIAKKYLSREVCEVAVRKNGMNLKYVPEQYCDADMCLAAVQNDGDSLQEVPKQILLGDRGYEICFAAVSNGFDRSLLSVVPKNYLKGDKGKALCKAAVTVNGYSFEYLPARLKTEEFAKLAVEAQFPVRHVIRLDGSSITRRSYFTNHSILSIIPKQLISRELATRAIRLHPDNMRYVPPEFVSRDLCLEMLDQDPTNVRYMPFIDKKLIDYAIDKNPRAILCVPRSLLTLELCSNALQKDPTIPIIEFPEDICKKLEKKFPPVSVIKYEPIALETPEITGENGQILSTVDKAHTYDLAITDGTGDSISYITDIHLEHQLNNIMQLSLPEIKARIQDKVSELISSVTDTKGILLIGGDVADSVELESLFYKQLTAFDGWQGRIISVLGNHELWDGNPMGMQPVRAVDEIISSYRKMLPTRVTLLENELFIMYKGVRSAVLDEQTILSANIDELTEVCADSTLIVLGGIGFSGLNPVYNSKAGLYRAVVTPEEDAARARRFRAVYEKILSCAGNLRVIVLTHTQMADWSNAEYNSNWIYVSGHTHQNSYLLKENGPAVFSDNQVGYKPKIWHLNTFTLDVHRYDPFKGYPDGIHRITREQYIEFNRCQGIMMQDMRSHGEIYALKRDGFYMFVLDSVSGLYLLNGGKRQKLYYDIRYYYNNLPEYVTRVRDALLPYQKALSMVSDEVKLIGGTGTVHGCIVDIDFFKHVYLNPFDGKVTPYFAFNITDKVVFDNMISLLESSPFPPIQQRNKSILSRFMTMSKEGKLPVLSCNTNKEWKLAIVPQVVLDKSMYKPSRIMRSIQYIFDQNVVRIWNDEVFIIDYDGKHPVLPGMKQLLGL